MPKKITGKYEQAKLEFPDGWGEGVFEKIPLVGKKYGYFLELCEHKYIKLPEFLKR